MSVVVVSADLMDRSKLAAALPEASVVRTLRAAVEAADRATTIVVDLRLAETGDLAELVHRGARVVAYGSHVDDETLAAAGAAGAEVLPRSVFFRRLADGAI